LFLPSGKFLRQLSLGYEGLLADIYWTRVVQYFGRKRLAHSNEFKLLGPLLQITTDLDPHLLVAYRFGSIFLAQKPPQGAGQPQEALALLRRGIVANPDYWRLWEDLGFVYYWDLKDYPAAARVFQTGSERPGAMQWMRIMAAKVAAEGGQLATSRFLWSEIARQADNEQIRKNAEEHLMAIKATEEITKLDELLALYNSRQGRPARSLQALVVAGYLRATPRDPSGAPYILDPGGRARLNPRSSVDLSLLQ
jgi:tetratricopeptide (TPR) repeat protein